MSEEALPPPPAYEEVTKISNANWRAWHRRLIALQFTQEEATEYARLFVSNEIETNMIPELNDGVLKSIGIEKAGHRIRILRLQNKASTSARTREVPVARPTVIIPRCAWHLNVVAYDKCHKCNRLICLQCRRQKANASCIRYYCQNCYGDCVIL